MWRNKKGKIRRVWKLLMALVVFLYFLPLLLRVLPFGMSKKETISYFKSQHIKFIDTVAYLENRKIHYIAAGNDTCPMLLLIHGSPGSWNDLKEYVSDSHLLKKYYVIAYDRPGFGGSDMPASQDLQHQAQAAGWFVENRKNKYPVMVVGHSYGGPVAVQLAVNKPRDMKAVVLVSPTIDPEAEENNAAKKFLQSYSMAWPFKWMMSKEIVRCTQEMRHLPSNIRQMQKGYARIKCQIIEFHGKEDWIAPISNQTYVCNNFVCAKVDTLTEADGDHFLVWSKHDRIVELLLNAANQENIR